MSGVRARSGRTHARGSVLVFLRMHALWDTAEAEDGGLLRVLHARRREMRAEARRAASSGGEAMAYVTPAVDATAGGRFEDCARRRDEILAIPITFLGDPIF